MADPAQRQLLHEELLGRNANSLAHTKKWKSSSHLALNVFRCLTNRRQFAGPQQIEFPLSLGTWMRSKLRLALNGPSVKQLTGGCHEASKWLLLCLDRRAISLFFHSRPTATQIANEWPTQKRCTEMHKNSWAKSGRKLYQRRTEMASGSSRKRLHLTSKSISTSNSGGYEMQLMRRPFGRLGARKLWGCGKSNNIGGNNCHHTHVWVHQRHVGQCINIWPGSIIRRSRSLAAYLSNLRGYDF